MRDLLNNGQTASNKNTKFTGTCQFKLDLVAWFRAKSTQIKFYIKFYKQ